MISSTTKFWFRLLDSTTGQPYKGTTADFVSLPPGAVVAELQDAVLSKNSNKLSSVDASDLLVYKNKAAAFDNRSAAKNEGKVPDPLDPTQSIDGLGSTHNMLIVVVPSSASLSSSSALRINQPSSFPSCQVQFFNSFGDTTESHGGWISFGHEVMPSTSLNNLYIRECYRTIAESILEGNGSRKAIITGTPGIGKSLSLIYLL